MIRLAARALAWARWYAAEFFGDTAYDKYLARHALAHAAGGPPLTRREFYRRRASSTAATGCC
ncbi:MAG: YbdD/YjiX family protein [Bifidobacteriaceae bacterium]|jgi:uncharacterized short protein YbdD (DUF466 family)|nr:YbdD/YjiX family protein [Bifidobacteriaceae bacterium]